MKLIAQQLTEELLGADVQSVEPVVGNGSVNAVFVVRARTGVFVVRLNDPTSLAQFEKEAWCIERAAAAGIPGAHVVAIGALSEHAYMLLSFVPGEHGPEAADSPRLWRTLGDYARRTHAISVAGWGDAMTSPGVFAGSWDKHLDYNIDALSPTDVLRRRGVINARLSAVLRERFVWLRERDFAFGLCHGDLALRNLVVNGELVSLLDWGSAEAHVVPHYDVLEVLKSSFQLQAAAADFQSFLAGYGIQRSEFAAVKDELDGLLLLRATDKLRWALDRSPVRVAHYTHYLGEVIAAVEPT
jgi:aminoglycoside phosphotransferase